MSDRYGRVQLLLSQRRHEMAERDLRMLLADDPGDATAQSLLALCILHDRSRMLEATEMAQHAVGLAPDEPLGHYALAVSYLQRNRNEEAAAAIQESLRLDPYDADAFAVLSRAQLARDRYQQSLDAAVQGLAVDPEHLDCGNLRSISLERLGRGDEAIAAATETLRRDPDDPMSHAAHGHALLNSGRYKEAQVAFREALRLDPHHEMARVGLIHALNNRSMLFRWVHRFYVTLSRLNSSAALGLIFGAWILVQVLTRVVGPAVPVLQPFIFPIVALYVFFVVLTWIANPLFNSFLRFHPFGQHLLDRSQRWASNLIAPCLAAIGIRIRRGLFFRQPDSRVACCRVLVGNGNPDFRNVSDAHTKTPTVGRSSDGGDRIGPSLRSDSRTVRSIAGPAVPQLRAIRLVSAGNSDRQQRDRDQAGKSIRGVRRQGSWGSWGTGWLGNWVAELVAGVSVSEPQDCSGITGGSLTLDHQPP